MLPPKELFILAVLLKLILAAPLHSIDTIVGKEAVTNPNQHPWIVNVIRRNGDFYG